MVIMATFSPQWFIAALFILSALGSAEALVFGTYTPTKHNRFASGFPGTSATASTNSNFLMNGYDLSGIGWSLADSNDTATMISPRHFITAKHVAMVSGGSLRFLGIDGTIRNYVIDSLESTVNTSNEATDLLIGTLAQDVHSSITFYPIADLPNESDYYDKPIFLQGLHARWGTGTIKDDTSDPNNPFLTFTVPSASPPINATRGFEFRVDTTDNSRSQDDVYFQSGDSSDPTFIILNGNLAVIGVHTAVDVTTTLKRSFDTFVPHYIDQINAFIAPEGYSVTSVGNGPSPMLTLSSTDSLDPAQGGIPFTYNFTANNTSSFSAMNINVEITLPPGGVYGGFSGPGWSASHTSGVVTASRTSISGNNSSNFQITYTPPAETTSELVLNGTISASGAPNSGTTSETTQVYRPFSDFVNGLTNTTEDGDPDGDGIANLTEYLLGLDAGNHSSEPNLAPSADGTFTYTRRRRTDITGTLMVSQNLTSWTTLTGTETTTPLDYNFETVTFEPSTPFETGDRRFLKLKVEN